jgi:hypothetical protein
VGPPEEPEKSIPQSAETPNLEPSHHLHQFRAHDGKKRYEDTLVSGTGEDACVY